MKVAKEIEYIEVENIEVGERIRPLDQTRVAALAESIKEIGLLQPLTFRTIPEMEIDGVTNVDVPVLVAGYHRLEAAKLAGLTSVPCLEITASEIDAELWEISENLHRSELTALERDQHIARWIELAGSKVAQLAPVSGGRGNTGGINQATRDLGIERTDAQRAVKVAALTDEAKEAAKEAGLDDNRTALLQAAKAEPGQQASVIRSYAEKRQADRNKLDSDLASRAAKTLAEMMAEHFPADCWDVAKANLAIAKSKDIMVELNNITGQSIMDRRYGS